MWFEPMFLHEPSILGVPLPFVILAVGGVGALIGLLWIHRITGPDEDPGRSIFRDREPGVGWHLTELLDLVHGLLAVGIALPMPIRRRLTVRWLVTRLELGAAIAGVAVASLGLSSMIGLDRPTIPGPDWVLVLAMAGTAGAIAGTIWMFRIAYSEPASNLSIWRTRDD
jgi:hypothetical protein